MLNDDRYTTLVGRVLIAAIFLMSGLGRSPIRKVLRDTCRRWG